MNAPLRAAQPKVSKHRCTPCLSIRLVLTFKKPGCQQQTVASVLTDISETAIGLLAILFPQLLGTGKGLTQRDQDRAAYFLGSPAGRRAQARLANLFLEEG